MQKSTYIYLKALTTKSMEILKKGKSIVKFKCSCDPHLFQSIFSKLFLISLNILML